MNGSNEQPGVHFIAPYLLNPTHRIVVDVVGAGGNGSQMLSALARMNAALEALGRTGLYVRVFDPDTVEEPNIGRQLFSGSEIGLNKAVALMSRLNRFYGTSWDAFPTAYNPRVVNNVFPNIIITCVDNLGARRDVSSWMRKGGERDGDEYRTWYWLDLGNAQRTGQAVLGSRDVPQPELKDIRTVGSLPLFTDCFDIDSIDERDSGPSCSLAEALLRQDLFVNSALVQLAGSLLWTLLKDGQVSVRGFYLNLETLTCMPMEI